MKRNGQDKPEAGRAPEPSDDEWPLEGGTMAAPTDPAAAATDSAHYLVIRDGEAAGLRLEVGSEPLVLGRGPACDLRLADPTVSTRHCRVVKSGAAVQVEDLGSTNGTFVDGDRIAAARRIRADAVVQIGSQVLVHEIRSRAEVARMRQAQDELDRARSYVEALLPTPLEEPDLVSDWCFEPCDVLGGDAFGHHRLADGRLAITLIDVCGHGTSAALHSVSVINALRQQSLAGVDWGDPAQVLAGLNAVYPMEEHDGMYFTAWYGVLETATRRLVFASAGHPEALLVEQGQPARKLPSQGMAIGMKTGESYTNSVEILPAGSGLYVFSDGVFDFPTAGGRRWTEEEFVAVVGGRKGDAGTEVGRIRDEVHRVAGTRSLPDDFSLMVFDIAPRGRDQEPAGRSSGAL